MPTRRIPVALAFALGLAGAQAQTPLPEGTPFDPAQLAQVEIALTQVEPHPAYPQLPVLFEATVSNPTGVSLAVPLPVLAGRDDPYATLDLSYSRDGGPAQKVRVLLPEFGPFKEGIAPLPPRLIELPPGTSTSLRFVLSHDWISGEPEVVVDGGTLSLVARLCALEPAPLPLATDCSSGKDSSALAVSLAPPAGADAAALPALLALPQPWLPSAPQAADHISHGGSFAALNSLATLHDGTVYALYAKAVLAHMLATGDRLDLEPVRPADTAAALLLIDEVLADPRFLLDDDLIALRERLESQ